MTESTKWVGEIPADKLDFLIRRLQQQKKGAMSTGAEPGTADALAATGRIAARERSGDAFPLSFGQQQIWFMEQLNPGTPLFNIPAALRFTGRLDIPALARGLAEIVRRHEALRTRFPVRDSRPVQVPTETPGAAAFPLPVCDLSALPGPVRARAAEDFRAAEARRPIALAEEEGGEASSLLRALLVRETAQEHHLLLTLHHIAADGWSVGVLMRELGALYEAFAAGRPSPLPPLPVQYVDFALWQRERLQGEVLEGHVRYWRERLAGRPTVLELPADHPRPPVQSFRAGQERLALDLATLDAARRLANAEGASLFMVLLAAFDALLARYTCQEDIVVGTPVANRADTAVEGLIGFFVNTLVLRTGLQEDPTFGRLIGRVREAALGAFAHEELPFQQVVEALHPERDLSRSPLFQLFFSLQNAGMPPLRLPGLTATVLDGQSGSTQYDLSLTLTEAEGGAGTGGGMAGWLDYSADLFDPETVRRFAGHFATLLSGALADPGRRLSEVPLLTAAERSQILEEWARPAELAMPGELPVHGSIAAQARRTPEATALIHRGRGVTYRELEEQAEAVAWRLRRLGVEPGARVGICVERSISLVAALLGTLKTGAAYVPLDPVYPEARLALMVADADLAAVVTRSGLIHRLGDSGAGLPAVFLDREASLSDLDFDRDRGPVREPVPSTSADLGLEAPAYVMYTSGSTGKPKGVVVTHANVKRFFHSMEMEIPDHDGVVEPGTLLAVTSISFDISVLELFWTLAHGFRVVIQDEAPGRTAMAENPLAAGADPGTDPETETIPAQIARWGVTHLQGTPALAAMLAADPESLAGLRPLRHVLLGGEALQPALAAQVAAAIEGDLHNIYGPTEATVWSLRHGVRPGEERMPIGRPIGKDTVYLLDPWGSPVPAGVPGELYLGGFGISVGYWRRPELTAERFLPDPFAGRPGARLYRTGDLARWQTDGVVQFLGRLDHQVKIRGVRIELGEIEAVLGARADIAEAAVVAAPAGTGREDGGERRLVAYVVPDGHAPDAGSVALSITELRRYLGERLPESMIPALFVTLPALPRTPNGKVDRRALPAPAADRPDIETEYVAPQSPTEVLIAGVWQQALGSERIGIHDNFFEVGGTSLLLVEVQTRLKQALGRNLPVVQMFRNPSIHALAQFVDTEQPAMAAAVAAATVEAAEDRARLQAEALRGGTAGGGAIDRQRQFLEERRKKRGGQRPSSR